jgi:hypothetical protein
MFSKPIKENYEGVDNKLKNTLKQSSDTTVLTYREYFSKNIQLKKCKLPELKTLVKQYGLPRTGNKDVLIVRLENLFKTMNSSVAIQKIFRGWMVRYSFQLRGDAVKICDREKCVNDTDFVTLEPLNEIPYQLFFSYKDEKDFIYGFNITSLVQSFKNGKKINPYNRDKFPNKTINKVISLNNITKIVYPAFCDEIQFLYLVKSTHLRTPQLPERLRVLHDQRYNIHEQRAHRNHQNHLQTPPQNVDAINTDTPTEAVTFSSQYYNPRIINMANMNDDLLNKYNKIIQSRNKNINTRIHELFMEIDQLGNYTTSLWFFNLDRRSYLRFFRAVMDIWNFRAQIPQEVKNKISPIVDPFANIFNRNVFSNDLSLENIQLMCITIMEVLIYTGVDDDHRKIGTLHILSALTLVCHEARHAMPWLYESVIF